MPNPAYRRMQQELADPALMQAQEAEDLAPEGNIAQLQSTMKHGDMQGPRQQAILQQEMQRLQQAQQQLSQRLQKRLNVRIGTPEDSDPQAAKAAFMTRLMMQMRQGSPR